MTEWRLLRRLWGRLALGDWRVLGLSLCVCTAAAGAVGVLQQRLGATLERSSSEALGADARVSSREELPAAWPSQAHGLGLAIVQATEFPSVVMRGERFQLASVKAVDAGYPLRGTLWLAPTPLAAATPAQALPPRGSVYVDARLWAALDLSPGARLSLGTSTLTVAGVIAQEPDRGGAFAELQPRLFVNLADVAATGLLGPGSRVMHFMLLAGTPDALARMQAVVGATPGVTWQTPRSARPEVARSLDRATRFVRLSVVLTALLCAAALALSSQRISVRLADEVALLKAMGATSARVLRRVLAELGLTWAIASVASVPIAWAVQAAVVEQVRPLLNADPQPARLAPLAAAALLGVLVLSGFALPPLWRLRGVPPVRIFQRQVPSARTRAGTWAAIAGIVGVLWLEVDNGRMLGWVALGTASSALALALLGAGLLALLGRWGGGRSVWRQALRQMSRRRGATIAQVVALGVALLSLTLTVVVRQQLLGQWRAQLPPRSPNEFVINIQPAQVQAVQALLARHGQPGAVLSPMTRGRLTAINGAAVTAASLKDAEVRNWVDHEFNLSWGERFADDNTLVQGRWWGPAERGQPIVSVEQTAVDRLGLHLGDRLTLDFAGHPLTLQVYNIRKTQWDRFRPNFFFVTPPGVLDSGPTQYLTSLYVPTGERQLLLDLVREFPNVTPLDLSAALDQVRRIVEEVGNAIASLFAFTVAGGALVLLAVTEASRTERRYEAALQRALGASRRRLVIGIATEYAVLGLLAGAVAGIAAQGIAFALARFVFSLDFKVSATVLFAAPGGGAVLATVLGLAALLPVTATPPRRVLEQDP